MKNGLSVTYLVKNNGDVIVTQSAIPRKDMIRFGMQLKLAKDYDTMTWFEKGPPMKLIVTEKQAPQLVSIQEKLKVVPVRIKPGSILQGI